MNTKRKSLRQSNAFDIAKEADSKSKRAVRLTPAAAKVLPVVSGCDAQAFAYQFARQAAGVLQTPTAQAVVTTTVEVAILRLSVAAADAQEGTLAVQIFALHSASMQQSLQRGIHVVDGDLVDQALKPVRAVPAPPPGPAGQPGAVHERRKREKRVFKRDEGLATRDRRRNGKQVG